MMYFILFKVDFGAIAKVTRIATQGRPDANHWVTEYTLSSSLDGGHFEPYKKVCTFCLKGL